MNHQVDLHLTDLILSGLSVDTEAVSHRLTPTPAPRTHGDSHRVAADAVTGGDFDAGRGQISDQILKKIILLVVFVSFRLLQN